MCWSSGQPWVGGLLKTPFYRWEREAEPLAEAIFRGNSLVGSAGASEALLFCHVLACQSQAAGLEINTKLRGVESPPHL